MFIPNTLNLAAGSIDAIAQQFGMPKLQAPTENTGRAAGDYRTVDEITKNPLFDNLLTPLPADKMPTSAHLDPFTNPYAARLEEHRIDDFYDKVGGNWNDPSLSDSERADIAANAERVLEYIDRLGGNNSTVGDQMINGMSSALPRLYYNRLTTEHLTTEGSEARLLLNFADHGYDVFH